MKRKDLKKEPGTDWERIDVLKEEEIDYSDIPELDDEFFQKATFVPAKQTVTIRLDADVLSWLKENGKGYQTRANRILRAVMEASRKNLLKREAGEMTRKRTN